jgi:predicted dehydrogenase
MDELPKSVNCSGNAHITPGIEDVTSMCINYTKDRFAIVQSSWLDPRKVREMTIVGSKRMIVYDDVETQEKIKIYDARVDVPPHYDTFAEFHYSYHYGDRYIPYVKQDEPLRIECQHFIDCIREGKAPLTSGRQGLEVVRVLEGASTSLKQNGAMVSLIPQQQAAKPATVRPKNGDVPVQRFDIDLGTISKPTTVAQPAPATVRA